MAKKKPKPMTAGELAGMSHRELASVGTKRRVMAALRKPPAAKRPERPPAEENLRPVDRMRRGHAADGLDARRARRGELDEKGANDGRS